TPFALISVFRCAPDTLYCCCICTNSLQDWLYIRRADVRLAMCSWRNRLFDKPRPVCTDDSRLDCTCMNVLCSCHTACVPCLPDLSNGRDSSTRNGLCGSDFCC